MNRPLSRTILPLVALGIFQGPGRALAQAEPAAVEAPPAEAPVLAAPPVEAPRVEAPRVEAPRVEAPAPVATRGRARRVIRLAEALSLAEKNYPEVRAARARYDKTRAQLREAHSAPFSEFNLTAGAGLIPAWRGTTVYSPSSDQAITSEMSLAYQVALEGVVPLWTFGKLTNLWQAARAGTEAAGHEVEKEKAEIRFEVRRAYYGVQLARDALLLIEEASKRVEEYLERLEAGVESGDSDEIELLKLKVQRAELVARSSEALRQMEIARAGLRFFTGASTPLDAVDEPLAPTGHELGPVTRYLEAARLHRPEVNMARAGVDAREAQLRMERARYFPDVGLGLTARVTGAPGQTNQRNPFSYDPLNTPVVGLGLVLRWKLDFFPQSARVAQATAALEEMRATEQYALGGVAVEVEKAFAEAVDAKRRLDAWGDAAQYAKQWLIKVQQGLDLGLTENEDLVEPSKEFALKRFAEMSALFDYNVALAALAAKTGWEEMLRGG